MKSDVTLLVKSTAREIENTLCIKSYSRTENAEYIETVEYYKLFGMIKMPYYRQLTRGIYQSAWKDRITGEHSPIFVQREVFNQLSEVLTKGINCK